MKGLKLLSSRQPALFGLAVTFVLILAVIVSAVLGNLWPGDAAYGQPGGIVGRLAASAILLAALARLGWLRTAGFQSLGSGTTWLALLLPLAYAVLGSAYAMTGRLGFQLHGASFNGMVILFILTAAFLEEAAFRGLVLHASVRAWGDTSGGLVKSILYASLLFCSIHLLDFLSGRSLLEVALQSLQAFFLGIWLAALVLKSRSIYPAVFFHAILNLAGYASFTSRGIQSAPSSWLLLSLFMLPLALAGISLVRGLPERPAIGAAQLSEGD